MTAPYFSHGPSSVKFNVITVSDGTTEQIITAEEAWAAFHNLTDAEVAEDFAKVQAKLDETDGVQRKLRAELDLWYLALCHSLRANGRNDALIIADWAVAQYAARAEALGVRL